MTDQTIPDIIDHVVSVRKSLLFNAFNYLISAIGSASFIDLKSPDSRAYF